MRSFVFTLLLLAFVLITPTAPMQAQDEDFPPFAAYQADDYLYLFRPNEPPLRISENPDSHPNSLVWSPNGQLLAFESVSGVTVFDLATLSSKNIPIYPVSYFPLAFTIDGKGLLYGDDDGADGWDGPYWLKINAVSILEKPSLETKLSRIEYPSGHAGGGYTPPVQFIFESETGWYFGPSVLEDTPYGILFTAPLGGIQLDYDTIAETTCSVLSLSANRTHVAIPGDCAISVIDLATKETKDYQTETCPRVTAWDNAGHIYYSSSEYIKDLFDELSSAEQEKFVNIYAGEVYEDWALVPIYETSLYQLDLTTGATKRLYTTNAYDIGRLMPLPDGSEIFFSEIPNMDDWLNFVLSLEKWCENPDCDEPYLRPSLYRLNVATGQVDLIGEGVYNATMNFTYPGK